MGGQKVNIFSGILSSNLQFNWKSINVLNFFSTWKKNHNQSTEFKFPYCVISTWRNSVYEYSFLNNVLLVLLWANWTYHKFTITWHTQIPIAILVYFDCIKMCDNNHNATKFENSSDIFIACKIRQEILQYFTLISHFRA